VAQGTSEAVTAALTELRDAVAGPVLTRGDDGFADEVAVFDLTLHHTPDIAVGITSTADVAAALPIARRHGLNVSVIGTGHADVPLIAGGIVLAMRRLDAVTVDKESATATVGGGAAWRPVVEAAAPLGLAPLTGSAPDVGAVGLVLGGGIGPISRTYGFSADHVKSFEVVMVDGSVRQVDAEGEPDLFWALRGGKGALGVITGMTVDLLPLWEIYGGGVYFAAEQIPDLVRGYQRWVTSGPDTVPDALTTSLAILRLPDLPALPEVLRGRTVAHLRVGFVGPAEEGERLTAPLLEDRESLFGSFATLPYADIGTIHNDPTQPVANATGGLLLRSFEADTAETILQIAGPDVQTPLALVEVRHLGGALARPVAPADAIGGRDAAFGVWVASAPLVDPPPTPDALTVPAASRVVRTVLDALAPWATGGTLINFFGAVNTVAEFDHAWPSEVEERLERIRHAVDPDQVLTFGPTPAARADHSRA
jgi:FAD/FMN-containing dehydrogenase